MPLLTALAKDKRLQIVGINYKDSPDNARRFLGRYGNPFSMVGVDGNGRGSIEWGVYGVPETFVVGREGTIVYKMVGPVTPANVDTVLKVEIEKALKAGRNYRRHSGAREARARNPLIDATRGRNGFRARRFATPRNDDEIAPNNFPLLSAVHLAAMAPPRIRS